MAAAAVAAAAAADGLEYRFYSLKMNSMSHDVLCSYFQAVLNIRLARNLAKPSVFPKNQNHR